MNKKIQIFSIIIFVIILLCAVIYGKYIFLDKNEKVGNIESLQHSGAGDIK